MATYHNNLLVHGIEGKIGEHYFMNRGGKQILVRCPNRGGHVSKGAQKAGQDRFRLAQQYAKEVNLDPQRRAYYTPFRKGGKTEYNLALADFLKPPVILNVDVSGYRGKAGNELLVTAMDNIGITRLLVRIENQQGLLREEGDAIKTNGLDEWTYQVQYDQDWQTGDRVFITAYDNAGNQAEATALIG